MKGAGQGKNYDVFVVLRFGDFFKNSGSLLRVVFGIDRIVFEKDPDFSRSHAYFPVFRSRAAFRNFNAAAYWASGSFQMGFQNPEALYESVVHDLGLGRVVRSHRSGSGKYDGQIARGIQYFKNAVRRFSDR